MPASNGAASGLRLDNAVFNKFADPEQWVPDSVVRLGQSLHEIVVDELADLGTVVDTGYGFGAYDLWVTVDGVKHVISVRRSADGAAKAPVGRSPRSVLSRFNSRLGWAAVGCWGAVALSWLAVFAT